MNNEWKYPHEELPEPHTQVLCFIGGQRFGQYVFGDIRPDINGKPEWHLYEIDGFGCFAINAWQYLPDAPDFEKCNYE